MNFKYTNDGKKVSIVGSLNNKETIVQEIFVKSDGSEIPSGENFVVKSLHDNPVISWKEKKIQEIDELYQKKLLEQENKLNQLKIEERDILKSLSSRIKGYRNHYSKLSHKSFETLLDFLAGDIKYLVTWNHSKGPEIKKFGESIHKFDSTFGDYLKLITLYGDTQNNDLNYRMSRYSDGSGFEVEIFPFKTKKEAKEKCRTLAKEYVEKNKVCWTMIEVAKEYNIKISRDRIEDFKISQKQEESKSLNYINKQLTDKLERLKIIEKL